jgi:hypothetical protein
MIGCRVVLSRVELIDRLMEDLFGIGWLYVGVTAVARTGALAVLLVRAPPSPRDPTALVRGVALLRVALLLAIASPVAAISRSLPSQLLAVGLATVLAVALVRAARDGRAAIRFTLAAIAIEAAALIPLRHTLGRTMLPPLDDLRALAWVTGCALACSALASLGARNTLIAALAAAGAGLLAIALDAPYLLAASPLAVALVARKLAIAPTGASLQPIAEVFE